MGSGNGMEALDERLCGQLATLIRDNIDALALESYLRYKQDYPHSVNAMLEEGLARQWGRAVLLSFADQVERRDADAEEYASLRGDIVLQNEELSYPIEAFVEEALYEARIVADLVWRSFLGNDGTMAELLAIIETFTQARIRANMLSFADKISAPGTIVSTWQLGRRWLNDPAPCDGGADRREASEPPETACGTAPPREPDWAADLTPREQDVAGLAARGLSNAQVASQLCLQESTVRNTLSRIYAKLGITGRAELIVLANRR